jgi:hypothetical protein
VKIPTYRHSEQLQRPRPFGISAGVRRNAECIEKRLSFAEAGTIRQVVGKELHDIFDVRLRLQGSGIRRLQIGNGDIGDYGKILHAVGARIHILIVVLSNTYFSRIPQINS